MTTVERIKMYCKKKKVPIYKLERDCGFANGYIGQLKKGTVPDDRLMIISDYLNVPVEELTGRTGRADYQPATDYVIRSKEMELLIEEAEKHSPDNLRLITEMLKKMKI